MRPASSPNGDALAEGAVTTALETAWYASALATVVRALRPLRTWPPVETLVRAWDGSWVGAMARGIWCPGNLAPEREQPGQGLALVGLVALAVLDAWAFNVTSWAPARWIALAVTVLPVVASESAGLYVVLSVIPFVPDVIALVLVAGLTGLALVRRLDAVGWQPARLRLRLGWPATLLGLLLVVSTITSVNVQGSLRYLATWALAIGLYWVATDGIRDERVLARAALALGLSAALASLHGLYQFAIHEPVRRAWIDVRAFPTTGTRVFSFWDNPNVLALHLLLTGPLLAVSLWTARGRLARLSVGLAIVATGLASVLTLSRAGWAGLGVAVLLISLALDRRILIAGLLTAALAFVLAPGIVLSRLVTVFHFSDPTAVHRIRVWESAWRMVRDFWYSGLGLSWRAFAAVYPQYAIQGRVAFHAHSHYLETLVELGILGFAALHYVLLRPLAWVASLARSLRRTVAGSVLVGSAAAILGGLAFGVGEPIFYLPRPILLAWAVLGLATAAQAIAGTRAADGGEAGSNHA